MILSFAEDNGMVADKKNFAVYNVKDSYDNPKIQVYCPIKLVQNDNTNLIKFSRMKLINRKGV